MSSEFKGNEFLTAVSRRATATPPGPLLGATPPGPSSPRSNGIVPPDGGIREAPIVPGPTSASPWTNTLRLEDKTREVSGVPCR